MGMTFIFAKRLFPINNNSSKALPDRRRKNGVAFKAEALRLASEGRSTQAAARQLGSSA